MSCLSCFKCVLATLADGKEAVYKRTQNFSDGVIWLGFDTTTKDSFVISDSSDLATLNGITTYLNSCDGFGGSGGATCTPKSNSEIVNIGCDTVSGVTDNGDGTFTWSHNLGLLEPDKILFSPYAVIASTENEITFEAAYCIGDVMVSVLSLGASDCNTTGSGQTIAADNGLHIDTTTNKVYLGGTLVEDTNLNLDNKLFKIESNDGSNSYYTEYGTGYVEQIIESDVTGTKILQSNNTTELSTQSQSGTSIIKTNSTGVLTKTTLSNGIEWQNQSGKYKMGSVPFDLENTAEYDLLIGEDGYIKKTNTRRPDGVTCYSLTDLKNFIFNSDPTSYVENDVLNITADSLLNLVTLSTGSQYAKFDNVNYTAEAYALQFEFVYLSCNTIQSTASTSALFNTLYAPSLTTIVEDTAFDSVNGQKITLIIPLALHTHQSILTLQANNTVTLYDSDLLTSGFGFKKVVQNRSERFFDNNGIEVTDADTINLYKEYIRCFAVSIINCGGSVYIPNCNEFTATSGQTTFNLTSTPTSILSMYINGALVSFSAVSYSGSLATYTPSNNSNNTLSAGDRIQFIY